MQGDRQMELTFPCFPVTYSSLLIYNKKETDISCLEWLYVKNISHEMKLPLHSVSGNLTLSTGIFPQLTVLNMIDHLPYMLQI